MKHLKSYDTIFRAKPEELNLEWDYYHCTNCNSNYRVYRPRTIKCIYCQSIDVNLIETQKIITNEKNI